MYSLVYMQKNERERESDRERLLKNYPWPNNNEFNSETEK